MNERSFPVPNPTARKAVPNFGGALQVDWLFGLISVSRNYGHFEQYLSAFICVNRMTRFFSRTLVQIILACVPVTALAQDSIPVIRLDSFPSTVGQYQTVSYVRGNLNNNGVFTPTTSTRTVYLSTTELNNPNFQSGQYFYDGSPGLAD